MEVRSDQLQLLLAQIEHQAEFFAAQAPANEAEGLLQAEVFASLLDLGVIHALVPRSLGGLNLNSVDTLKIIEAISKADASTGWVAMATGFCTGAASAYLPTDAVDQIFATGTNGVVAGAGAPTGVARPVPGGFEVSGRWRYGSGLLHAEWAHCGLRVEREQPIDAPGAAAPELRIAYIPRTQVQLHGNWDVIGLRATGSIDFSVDKVFVPESFTVSSSHPQHRRGDAFFGETFTLGTLIGHCAWAMGTSRRLLAEVARFARTGNLRSGALGADPEFHAHFARFEALVRSGRALTYDAWSRAQSKIDSGQRLSTEDLTDIRLSLVFITEAAADAAYYAYRIAGGETLRQGTLQRLCRDILAGSQHITSAPTVMQACGRVLAGLAEGEIWSVNTLTPDSRRGDRE